MPGENLIGNKKKLTKMSAHMCGFWESVHFPLKCSVMNDKKIILPILFLKKINLLLLLVCSQEKDLFREESLQVRISAQGG